MQLNREQLETLVSPTRKRIYQELVAAGQSTAAELAPRVGVPLKRLYHHLHVLEDAGLLKVVDVRHGRGKPEKSYAPASDRLLLPNDGSLQDLVIREVAATLRLAGKEHEHAVRNQLEPSLIVRTVLRLTPEEAEELIRTITQALELAKARSHPEKEQQLAVTSLVTRT